MEHSTHKNEQDAMKHLKLRVGKLKPKLKNYSIQKSVVGQNDCLLLIKEDANGEEIRCIEGAEWKIK